MLKLALYVVAGLYLSTGIYMFVAPQAFYDGTPGVAMMGPFNTHFIRDAGLAFLVSGGGLLWGGLNRNHAVAVFGAIWPCLHALFHVWIWVARGVPFDLVALVNWGGIQLPAWLALVAAWKLKGQDG
ncbi:MAG: hypothetical protein NXH78_14130 [Hyphomonadaceae bacterium]|nr:hypothetical protein [Hyphomonadaceae bacterium]